MRISTRFILAASLVIALVGIAMAGLLRVHMRRHALAEAEAKAELLIVRNLSTHAYFTRELKPSVFAALGGARDEALFEPAWMSSTYAIRRMSEQLAATGETAEYYYKECAVNARSPENEADDYERAFLRRLNRDPALTSQSGIRVLEGRPYFVVLRRGESMEQACLLCHTEPELAPAGLVERYGPERSFGRHAGEVVSAVSVRIPLARAYAAADGVVARLSALLLVLLSVLAGTIVLVNRRIVTGPVQALRAQALAIAADERQLGHQMPVPGSPELGDLTRAFNTMSARLRAGREGLEGKVRERTVELEEANAELSRALAEVRTLSGLVPICASCKKIRDDTGYWSQLEHYLTERTAARFTHGLCPECAREILADAGLGRQEERD